MEQLRKENEELKLKYSLAERYKGKYKRQLVEIETTLEQEKTKIRKKLVDERKEAFTKYCQQKGKNLENQIRKLEEKNETLNITIADLEKRRDELESETTSLTNRVKESEREITKLNERNRHLEDENKQLSVRNTELEQNSYNLEGTLTGTLTRCEELQRNVNQLEQTLIDERQKQVDDAQKAAKKISDLEDILQISNQHNGRISTEIEGLHQENETLKHTSLRVTQELNYHKSTLGEKDKELLLLPSGWEVMPDNLNCKMFPASEQDFQMVSRRFLHTIQTLQVRILKVDRIQNKCLYKQYILKKTQISQHSKSSNEKLLWHGTHGEAVTGITVNGFDRGYKGFNVGTLFGQGVYFSTSSKYSTDYSKGNINKECHMFLARVLTGDSTLGKPEYKVLPVKDHSAYTRYESLVNDERNPSIYVVMNDTQAYPEYLVTYEVTGQ